MTAALFGILGLLTGALVNHVGIAFVSRSDLAPPRCVYCGSQRPWRQWMALPVLVFRKEGCPSCGAPLPVRSGLIELGLGATYAYLWIALGPSPCFPHYVVVGTVLAFILVTDFEAQRIPDAIIYPAIALVIAASFFTPGLDWRSTLGGGAVALGLYGLMAVIGRFAYPPGALGPGDVKLAAFIGLVAGHPLAFVAVVAAVLAAGLTSLLLIAARLRSRRDSIPYAPFLVAGAVVAALLGPTILNALAA